MHPTTRLSRPVILLTALLALSAACRVEQQKVTADDEPPEASPPAHRPDRFGLGHAASPQRLALIDIDVNPAGVGLPPGQGTWAEGAPLYAQKCALCHGAHGEGQGPYPQLIGAAPRDGFPFGTDPKIPKTIGNYWPYATTVYDYVHRAMPFNAPGSLSPPQVYALTAFLLAENQVIPKTAVMNAKSLPAVRMPARGHFVLDDRRGGQPFR